MRIDHTELADILAGMLETALQRVPDGFLDSFKYTTTGNNFAHPIVLGCLTRAAWELPGVGFVGVDVRLNLGGGVKFQPDIVGFGDTYQERLWMLDYESPNSSDARVVCKDVDTYVKWRRESGVSAHYLIVTTLPDCESPFWELRWTSHKHYNAAFCGRLAEIRKNPFRFWYDHYLSEFRGREMSGIVLLNISGRRVRRVFPESL